MLLRFCQAVDKELAKANEYYEYLKPSCLEARVNRGLLF